MSTTSRGPRRRTRLTTLAPVGRRVRPTHLLLAWWLAMPGPSQAQDRALSQGDRVRVTERCGPPLRAPDAPCVVHGTVLGITRDTLVVRTGDERVRRTLRWTRVEVTEVTGPDWRPAAAIGAVVGAGGTWLWLESGGSRSPCDRSQNQDALSNRECRALTVVGGAVGAALGVLTAKLLQNDRWVPVGLGRITLMIDPVLR